MIKYIKISDDAWSEVKDSAMATIHKSYTGKEITVEWKARILKSEHSPIRELVIHVLFEDIPRWVADQLVRHTIGVNHYMSTGRPDRGNPPREEQTMENPTNLKMSLNAQAVINISKDRLCIGQVSPETRVVWENFLSELEQIQPEIVFYCVPSCVYRAACKETPGCGRWNKFIKDLSKDDICDIDKRYQEYHRGF